MRKFLLLALVVPLSASACQGARSPAPAVDPEFATTQSLNFVRAGIVRYAAARGGLPEDVRELCTREFLQGGEPPCTATGIPDAWGTPLVYRRIGNEYELRSAWRDRRAHTDDDVVMVPSRARERAPVLAGCYDLPRPPHGNYPARKLKLEPVETSPGVYRMNMGPRYWGYWYPVGDLVAVEFLAGRYVIPFLLRAEGDSLVGYEGSPWSRRERLVLPRVACQPEF